MHERVPLVALLDKFDHHRLHLGEDAGTDLGLLLHENVKGILVVILATFITEDFIEDERVVAVH